MLRLAHQILLQRHRVILLPAGFDYPEAQRDLIEAALRPARFTINDLKQQCPVIIADSVSDYTYSPVFSDDHHWDYKEDIPNLAPPWERFFIEWKLPARYNAPDSPVKMIRQGWHFRALQTDPEKQDKGGWQLLATHWLFTSKGQVIFPGDVALIDISPAGQFRDWKLLSRQTKNGGESIDVLNLHIPFLTICFLHCRSTTLSDSTRTEGPTPKTLRRMKLPMLRYRTINIEPLKRTLHDEGHSESTGLRKALHICRGHFAHYIDDGMSQGLFGRRRFGTFWIPAHTRGSLEHGRVISTYNVKAPT